MLSVRLPVNTRLLVDEFWGSQTLCADFHLSGVLVPHRLFFKSKLYCLCLTVSIFLVPVLSNPLYANFFLPVTLLKLFLLKLAMAWKRGLQAFPTGRSGQCLLLMPVARFP